MYIYNDGLKQHNFKCILTTTKENKKIYISSLYKNEPFVEIIKQTKLDRAIPFEVNWVFFYTMVLEKLV